MQTELEHNADGTPDYLPVLGRIEERLTKIEAILDKLEPLLDAVADNPMVKGMLG